MSWAALLLALALPAAGREAADFLRLEGGARALAMGGAHTAVADDVHAMRWNPAGLASLDRPELGATHAQLFAGTRADSIGYAHPSRLGVLGVGASYVSRGSIPGRDESGAPRGDFTAWDLAVDLGYAPPAPAALPQSRLGAVIRLLQSRIAEARADGYALDLGALYELQGGWTGPGVPSLGVAVKNLGPPIKHVSERAPLPLTLAAGLAYRLPFGTTFALDLKRRPYAGVSELSGGLEHSLLESVALRAGYESPAGLAAGFGLQALGYRVDFSMLPLGEDGGAQRLSLGARF